VGLNRTDAEVVPMKRPDAPNGCTAVTEADRVEMAMAARISRN
jgi:hypothetical protein